MVEIAGRTYPNTSSNSKYGVEIEKTMTGDVRLQIHETFSDAVRRLLKEKKMTQVELGRISGYSRSTINRICRNNNDKGKGQPFNPPEEMIEEFAYAFELNQKQKYDWLVYTAFPRRLLVDYTLDNKISKIKANAILYEHDLPLLHDAVRDTYIPR